MRAYLLALVFVLASAQPSFAQASQTFLQFASSATDTDSYTFSAQNLGTEAGDRVIVAAVFSRRSTATVTLNSASIGGVAATIHVQNSRSAGGGSNVVAIISAAVPTGTTGDVVVTFNTTMLRAGIALYRMVGGSETPTDTDSSVVDDPTVNLDIAANGVAFAAALAGGTPTETWTGLTEQQATAIESSGRMTSASDDFAMQQTGLTILCDYTANSGDVGVFASFPAAGGAGSAVTGSFPFLGGVAR